MTRRLIPAALLFALLVAAVPAAGELSGPFSWRWSEAKDPITDRIVRKASVDTLSVKFNGWPRVMLATVILACFEAKPVLVFDWDAKVAAKEGLIVEYRFDGHPGRRVDAKYVRRSRQTTGDLGNIRQFLRDASISEGLYLRVRSPAYGNVEARFHTRGGSVLAARFGQYCPTALRP
jgi:hypothetical protein